MVDEHVSLHRNPRHDWNVVCTLPKAFRRSLLVNSRWQAEKSADDIFACLELATGNPEIRGTYTVLKRWYLHASAREPNPSRLDMAKVTGYYATLY